MVRVQSYCLTARSETGHTVLHHACHMGNVQICKFLVEQAGPKELDVLQFIIEDRDRLNMTPLMLLCQRGYKQSFDEMEQRVERRRA